MDVLLMAIFIMGERVLSAFNRILNILLMELSVFDCEELSKRIKVDLEAERETVVLDDLCLDPCSRYRYLDKLAHSKAEPGQVLLKRINRLKQSLPDRYHSHLDRVLLQVEKGSLQGR